VLDGDSSMVTGLARIIRCSKDRQGRRQYHGHHNQRYRQN